ncbi:MAG: hypothetical protein GX219_02035 [Tissierellia bacterium]|nr:hypothetical protein [Tissierellia bacterium]
MKWNAAKLLERIATNEGKVAELYKSLAENTKFGEKFFLNMAEDELRHEHMYRKLIENNAEALMVEIDDEYSEYLDLLIENDMFKDSDELLKKAKNLIDRSQVLDLCEKVERDAVMYVSEIINLLPNLAAKEMKVVLKEEKKHLQMILQKKADRGIFGIGM